MIYHYLQQNLSHYRNAYRQLKGFLGSSSWKLCLQAIWWK